MRKSEKNINAQASLEYLTVYAILLVVFISSAMPGGALRSAFSGYFLEFGDAAGGIDQPEIERRENIKDCFRAYMIQCPLNIRQQEENEAGANRCVPGTSWDFGQCLTDRLTERQGCFDQWCICASAGL